MVLAMAVCAALFHRERSGEGQHISGSLLATGMTMMGREIARSPVFDAATRDPMMERIEAVRARGGDYRAVVRERGGVYDLLGPQVRLYYGGYAVRDGAIILGALSDRNRDQIRALLGIADDPTEDLEFDVLDPANRPAIDRTRRKIAEILRTQSADEWLAELDCLGVPASKVYLPEELADDPGVQEAWIMIDVEHELTGPEQFVGPLVRCRAHPPARLGSRRCSVATPARCSGRQISQRTRSTTSTRAAPSPRRDGSALQAIVSVGRGARPLAR